MKKVLALVLAVMMMSTFAFAANHVAADKDFANKYPGTNLDILAGDIGVATATDLKSDNYTVSKISWAKGRTLVDSVKINDKNNKVVVALKDNYTLEKATDLEGTITIRQKASPRDTFEITITAVVKNDLIEKDMAGGINLPTTGDEVSLTPLSDAIYVVGATQGYGALTFGGADYEVTGRVYDKEKLYLYSDPSFYDKNVLLANEDVDADINFLDFAAKPTFKGLQTVSLFIDEDSKVYENKDGKLTEIKGKYDKDTGAFVFTTRTLGSYAWADKALKSVAGTTAPSEGNPDTGANDVVGIATALAAVALVSAAAISLKK